jgi:hypothetical protein
MVNAVLSDRSPSFPFLFYFLPESPRKSSRSWGLALISQFKVYAFLHVLMLFSNSIPFITGSLRLVHKDATIHIEGFAGDVFGLL